MSTSSTRDISPPPPKRRRLERGSGIAPNLPSQSLTSLDNDEFRVFTWNINGIKPFLQPAITSFFQPSKKRPRSSSPEAKESISSEKSYNLRKILERWHWPQVVCLQEVKIAASDHTTPKAVQQAVKAPKDSLSPSYKAFFSLPTDKINAKGFGGKLYGVCTLVRADVLGDDRNEPLQITIKPVEWEQEGRVLAMEIPKRHILVLNVYAVNGTDYPYKDKNGHPIGTRHDFKRKFHTMLQDMTRSFEKRGWYVVIAGDINIAQGPEDGYPGIRLGEAHVQNRKDFHDKFMGPVASGGLSMVDSFRHLHQLARKYTYRSPNVPWGSSCDRVDLILLTRKMVEATVLQEADILDEERERGPSDHLPSFVTLDFSRLQDERERLALSHRDDSPAL